MTWSNYADSYKNSQCFSDRFANVKNTDTIGDLNDTHSDTKDSINSMSISADENQLDQNNVSIAINSHHGNDDGSFSSIDEER